MFYAKLLFNLSKLNLEEQKLEYDDYESLHGGGN